METRQFDLMDRLVGVRGFVRGHPEVPKAVAESGTMRLLDALIVDMEGLAAEQETLDTKPTVAVRAELRKLLVEHHVAPIINMAALALEGMFGLSLEGTILMQTLKAPAADVRDVGLQAYVHSLANLVAPYTTYFVEMGLRPTFVSELREACDRYFAAAINVSANKSARISTTTGAKQFEKRGRLLIKGVHGLIQHHVAPVPALKAEWNALRRLPAHVPASRQPALSAGSAPKQLTPRLPSPDRAVVGGFGG